MDGIDKDNIYYQDVCATCLTNNETIDLLGEKFFNRVISKILGLNAFRPLPLGPLKDMAYADRPTSIQYLKDEIRESIEATQQPLYDLWLENFVKRMRYCKHSAFFIFSHLFYLYESFPAPPLVYIVYSLKKNILTFLFFNFICSYKIVIIAHFLLYYFTFVRKPQQRQKYTFVNTFEE